MTRQPPFRIAVDRPLALSMGLGTSPAEAVTPVLAAPERVYTGVDIPLLFTGTDPISGDDKAMQITAPSAGCDPLADGPDPNTDPDYALGNCARVQLDVGYGELAIGVQTLLGGATQPDGIATGGAIIESSGNGDGTGLTINLNGTQTQLTDALATLVWTPPSGFEDTNNPVRYLGVLVVDGNSSDNVSKDIELRVEGINEIPSLTVAPTRTWRRTQTDSLQAPREHQRRLFMIDMISTRTSSATGSAGDVHHVQYCCAAVADHRERPQEPAHGGRRLDSAVADAIIAALPAEVRASRSPPAARPIPRWPWPRSVSSTR